jgi:hypothetical protein
MGYTAFGELTRPKDRCPPRHMFSVRHAWSAFFRNAGSPGPPPNLAVMFSPSPLDRTRFLCRSLTMRRRRSGISARRSDPAWQPREPHWDLETLVPKLRRGWYGTHALLLIAHTVSVKEIEGALGKTADRVFLDRYALGHHCREWDDRYARGFRTALHLWVPRINDAECGITPNHDPGDGS